MICEKIYGKLDALSPGGRAVEYVSIDWDDAFKKIHKKTTDKGREVGIRMDDTVLTRGLSEGDVIYMDDSLVIDPQQAHGPGYHRSLPFSGD